MTCLENIEDFVKTSREESSFEWRIPNFYSRYYEEGPTIIFKSPNFYFCGAHLSFELYPCVAEGESLDSAYFAFCVSRENEKIDGPPATFNLTFGIKGPEGVEMKEEGEIKLSHYCRMHEWPCFLSMCELGDRKDRLVPNDVLTFTCEMRKDSLSSARGVEQLQKSLRCMLMSGEDCDIVFKVQGKEFLAHRIMLQARSPVFRAMFVHNMVEKQTGEVAIDDCDPQVFSDFLDHVYTGSSEKINQGNVFELYTVSDKYEMDTLKEQCVDCMKRNLSVASFCNVMKLALKHDDNELIEFTTQFFCSNTSDIVLTNDWTVFYGENSAFGYKLLIKTLTK